MFSCRWSGGGGGASELGVQAAGLPTAVQVGAVRGVALWHSHWEVHSAPLVTLCLTVPHQHCYCYFLRWVARRQLDRHPPPFAFISAVLEPDFHLGLCEFKSFCQVGPFGTREVPLCAEAALQLVDLCVREGRPGALLGTGPALPLIG